MGNSGGFTVELVQDPFHLSFQALQIYARLPISFSVTNSPTTLAKRAMITPESQKAFAAVVLPKIPDEPVVLPASTKTITMITP